jgi:hypothetical protein
MESSINRRLDRNFFFMAIILGIFLQFIAVSSNGYKMPVKSSYIYEDSTHFTYQDKSEVNFWLFTDIISIPNKTYIIAFSLGDLVMIFGLLGLITTIFRRKDERRPD